MSAVDHASLPVEQPTTTTGHKASHFVCCADHTKGICGSEVTEFMWLPHDDPSACIVCDDLNQQVDYVHCSACVTCPGCEACS